MSKFSLDCVFPVTCLGCAAYDFWLCLNCQKKLAARATRHCPFCGIRTVVGESCPDCRGRHYLDGLLSFFSYADEFIQSIIKTWKYHGVKRLIGPISIIIKDELETAKREKYFLKNKNSLIVPIPLHKRRLRERGFNQSAQLAEQIAKILEMPAMEILTRRKPTSAQANLRGKARLTNTVDAFALSGLTEITGKNIILIDDVITTGSTLDQAACLLKNNGAASVWAITFAYG